MREGGAEYRMQDPEVGRAEHTQVFRLEKKHKGGVSRERATEYRERVMKWQNPRIHDCSLHLQNGIDHHSNRSALSSAHTAERAVVKRPVSRVQLG